MKNFLDLTNILLKHHWQFDSTIPLDNTAQIRAHKGNRTIHISQTFPFTKTNRKIDLTITNQSANLTA